MSNHWNKKQLFHHIPIDQLLDQLETNQQWLTSHEHRKRLAQYGLNEIKQHHGKNWLMMFLEQFMNPLVFLLIAIAIWSWFVGKYLDSILIVCIIVINALMWRIQEIKAEKSINALKSLVVQTAKIIRDSTIIQIDSKEIVPWDIILLEEGDKIPADARLIHCKNFCTIESSLTGETYPVTKEIGVVDINTPLGDRSNMVWMGTFVSRWSAQAVVVSTWHSTVIGSIADQLQSVQTWTSNFSYKIEWLTKAIATIAIIAATINFGLGWLKGFDFFETLTFSLASLVSGIPEWLPAILTLVLAIWARYMAKQNAIVRTLTATETLGAVSIICTDKTWTLTQNTMTVTDLRLGSNNHITITGNGRSPHGTFFEQQQEISPLDNKIFTKWLEIATLCNKSTVEEKSPHQYEIMGDPTEAALFVLWQKAQLSKKNLSDQIVIIDDFPFNSDLKMRWTLVKYTNTPHKELFVIGATEVILSKSTSIWQHHWSHKPLNSSDFAYFEHIMHHASLNGMRLLWLATKQVPDNKTSVESDDFTDLNFVGIVGIVDPIRQEVPDAIKQCHEAWIKVIMLTGDHKTTALAIAKKIWLITEAEEEDHRLVRSEEELVDMSQQEFERIIPHTKIFARCTPQRKLAILTYLQNHNQIVAMTGDGVNDAPALKKAHVGIAMGKIWTDVAREASEIVLADDNFATIVNAIKQWRVIYNNVRKTSNEAFNRIIAWIGCLGWALLIGDSVPFIALQLLWLNLVTETIIGISLAFEKAEGDELKGKPIMLNEWLISTTTLPFVMFNAMWMIILTLSVYRYCLYYLNESGLFASSMAFLVIYFTQFANMLNLRSFKKSVFTLWFWSNKVLIGWIIISVLAQYLALHWDPLQKALNFASLSRSQIWLMFVLSSLIFWLGELYKFIAQRIKE